VTAEISGQRQEVLHEVVDQRSLFTGDLRQTMPWRLPMDSSTRLCQPDTELAAVPDADLVRVARSNDGASGAALELLRRHARVIEAVIARLRPAAHLCEDARQGAYLGFLRAMCTFDPARGTALANYAYAWALGGAREALYGRGEQLITVHLTSVLNDHLGDGRQPHYPRSLIVPDCADAVTTAQLASSALTAMTPLQQELVSGVYLHDLSQRALAIRLGLTPVHVNREVKRGLLSARKFLSAA
jgi:RNA polymerase sigma factor (sigma-70 family)